MLLPVGRQAYVLKKNQIRITPNGLLKLKPTNKNNTRISSIKRYIDYKGFAFFKN